MITLAEHTIDETILPPEPNVLDVGCLNFGFCREVLALRPQANIIALDPNPKIEDPEIPRVKFLNIALVADERMYAPYVDCHNQEANYIGEGLGQVDVPCVSITTLMDRYGIYKWDLVKLDIEGSEFPILENWPGMIATQISVEFHDYQDRRKYDDDYFKRLFAKLAGYKVVQHPLYSAGGGPGGHWDSLLTEA